MFHPATSVTRDRPTDPAQLRAADRDALVDELYAVHQQIFDGVDPAAFRQYVIEPKGARTRLQVFRDRAGSAVGYIAIHGFVRDVAGRRSLVIRSEVGLLRRFRGSAPQAQFVIRECARLFWKHRGLPKLVFACPVHPGSYFGVTRRAVESWPRPCSPTPPKIASILHELADEFGLQRVPRRGTMVRRVGWITRESERDRAYWTQHTSPEVQFFRTQNPGYADGDGLLMLIPLTGRLLIGAVLGRGVEWARKTARNLARPRRLRAHGERAC